MLAVLGEFRGLKSCLLGVVMMREVWDIEVISENQPILTLKGHRRAFFLQSPLKSALQGPF